MPNLFQRLSGGTTTERGGTTLPLSFQQWVDYFSFGNNTYPFVVNSGNQVQGNEEIGGSFQGYIDGIYKRNGVVFSCITARQLLFSEARFQFRRLRGGRPGDLFGTGELAVLERPWRTPPPAIFSPGRSPTSIWRGTSTPPAAGTRSGGSGRTG